MDAFALQACAEDALVLEGDFVLVVGHGGGVAEGGFLWSHGDDSDKVKGTPVE